MFIRSLWQRWLIAMLLCCMTLPALAQEVSVPALAARVTDTTDTLAPQQVQDLEQRLAALEQKKGAQLVILMVPTTGDDAIEQYATRVFDQWKLGRKSVDDGILLLVAKNDRKVRIEVGYGLEGVIPDSSAGRIIREYITPGFRQNDYYGGIGAAVDALTQLIDGEALPAPLVPEDSLDEFSTGKVWGAVVLGFMGLILGAVFSMGAFKRVLMTAVPSVLVGWLWTGSMVETVLFVIVALGIASHLVFYILNILGSGGGRYTGGGGGGGFSGGGGGFSGGGGSSGGGGASGGW